MNGDHQRINAIDGLRALAVSAVIAYHLLPRLFPGGFVGVDIFFVISGYVVCGSLLKTPANSFFNFASRFYAKRILRIYPPLLAMLMVVGLLSRLFIPDSWLAGASSSTGLFAFFGASNFQLVWQTDGYFAPNADFNPYLHTWSLAVEEQFYLLFPLVLFLCLRLERIGNPFAANVSRFVLPALFLVSLAHSAWETNTHPDRAYYLLTSRFWELALGAILCVQHQRERLRPITAAQASCLVLGGLTCVGLSILLADVSRFPFPWALAPCLGTACAIGGLVGPGQKHWAAAILSSRPVAYWGRVSYSLYLWHWPVMVLMRWTVGLESAWSLCTALLFTALMGILSDHWLEKPFQLPQRWFDQWTQLVMAEGNRAGGRTTVVLALPLNITLIVLGGGVIWLASHAYSRVSKSARLSLSVTMRPDKEVNPWRPRPRGISNKALSSGEAGRAWSGKRLFVLGDSHAGAYGEMLSLLRQREGVSIYLYFEGGARIASLIHPQRPVDRANEKAILADLSRYAQPGDAVVLASLRVLRFGDQWANSDLAKVIQQRDSAATEIDRQLAVQEGKDFIEKLEGLGLVVVIEAPKPVLLSPPFRCSDWFNRMNPIGRQGFVMHRDFLLKHRAAAMRSIAEVLAEHPQVKVWDPFPVLCPESTCSAFDGEVPLFFDTDHLSAHGNHKLYPDFVNTLEGIWRADSTRTATAKRR